MPFFNLIVLLLILIGAIEWGSIGFFNYNFLAALTGAPADVKSEGLRRIFYAIIGLAGIWGISFLFRKEFYKSCCSSPSKNCDEDK